jgi:hypothetical protein
MPKSVSTTKTGDTAFRSPRTRWFHASTASMSVKTHDTVERNASSQRRSRVVKDVVMASTPKWRPSRVAMLAPIRPTQTTRCCVNGPNHGTGCNAGKYVRTWRRTTCVKASVTIPRRMVTRSVTSTFSKTALIARSGPSGRGGFSRPVAWEKSASGAFPPAATAVLTLTRSYPFLSFALTSSRTFLTFSRNSFE